MSDNLKNFIQEHHKELDVAEPSQDMWNKIETRLDLNGTKLIKSKWLSKLKYLGFSASVLLVAMLLYKYDSNTNSVITVDQKNNETLVIKEENKIPDQKEEVIKEAEVKFREEKKQIKKPLNNVQTEIIKKEETNLPEELKTDQTEPKNELITENQVLKTNSFLPKTKQVKDENIVHIDTSFIGIKRLQVNVSAFDINVRGRSNDTVRVNGEINTVSKGLVVNKIDQKLKYERKDSLLIISIERTGKNTLIIGSFQQEATLNIDVPESIDLYINNEYGNDFVSGLKGKICNVKCSIGDIKISDIRSEISLQTNSGNIFVSKISGNVTAKASYGDIEIGDLKGSKCIINGTTANIKLTNVFADIDLEISTGDIFLKMITGNLKVESSFGTISVDSLRGKTCKIKNNTGDIGIKDMVADVDLQINTGDINMSKIEGNVMVGSSYGDIIISDLKGKTCQIKGNVGNVKLSENHSDVELDIVTGDISLISSEGIVKAKASYGNQLYENISGDLQIKNLSGDIKMKKITGNLNVIASYGNVYANDIKGQFSLNVSSGDIIGKDIEVTNNSDVRTGYGNVKMDLKNDLNELSFDLQATYGELKIKKNGEVLKSKDGKLIITDGKITITGISQSGDQSYE